MQISESGIDCLAEAVFVVENPQVVEAYSEYDLEPIYFSSSSELSNYIKHKLALPKGLAYIYVVYPDMEGQAIKRKIELNPLKVPNHKFRYTWEGWGLISIQVASTEIGLPSSVNANSEARAIKWEHTNREIDPPSLWNWAAVKRHTSRLRRILKKHA
ncbi:hypothetical protein JCM14076_12330 [Methylosoma difficile]